MAAKGFIKLLELSERAKQRAYGLPAQGERVEFWSGVGFTLGGQSCVAPMGEVTEVLSVPRYTQVPGVKSWMKGLANVRGRLLPIMDLPTFLNRTHAVQEFRRRLMVIDQDELFSGLVVDEVLGMQHFPAEDYRDDAPGVAPELLPYVQGSFERDGRFWAVFRLGLLLEDPRFLLAATEA